MIFEIMRTDRRSCTTSAPARAARLASGAASTPNLPPNIVIIGIVVIVILLFLLLVSEVRPISLLTLWVSEGLTRA